MKRTIIYILLIIILAALGVLGVLNRPAQYPSIEILGKTYYQYNVEDNTYEQLTINEHDVNYVGKKIDLTNCNNYKYDNISQKLTFTCKKEMYILAYTDNILAIRYDERTLYFYLNKESAENNDLEKGYDIDSIDYINETNRIINDIKIDSSKIKEYINSNKKYYVYKKPEECTGKCNVITRNLKNLTTKDIYYIEELDEETKNLIVAKDADALTYSNPIVIVINEGKIENIYEVTENVAGFIDRKEETVNE